MAVWMSVLRLWTCRPTTALFLVGSAVSRSRSMLWVRRHAGTRCWRVAPQSSYLQILPIEMVPTLSLVARTIVQTACWRVECGRWRRSRRPFLEKRLCALTFMVEIDWRLGYGGIQALRCGFVRASAAPCPAGGLSGGGQLLPQPRTTHSLLMTTPA